MSRTIVFTVMLCIGVSAASARLAETREDCEKRYGGPGKVIPAIVADSDADALVFHKDKLDITVHFKAGRVWHLSYMAVTLSELERKALLAENLQGSAWLPPKGEKIGELLFWRSSNGLAVASLLDRVDVVLFEFMSKACSESVAAQRQARILQARVASASPPPAGAGPAAPPAVESTTESKVPQPAESAPPTR